MPIADLAEAKDLHAEFDRLLNARTPAEAEDILRGIFAWKLDFDPLPPGATIALRDSKEDLPPTATRIATAEGVLVALVRLPSEKVTVAATREASKLIGDQAGDHLLVATNAAGSVWHFVYLVRRDGRDVRRRIVVERDQPRRTAMEQLAKVFTERRRADLRAALESAFNVDAVTKDFFKEYKSVFDDAMVQVKDSIPEEEPRRLFCQILFNRLMFLYFLQRKGWLRFNGRADYLQALREASRKAKEDSFYQARLKPLFFEALNKEPEVRDGKFEALLGDVPFLNGGLFEVSREEHAYPDVDVPNAALDRIVGPSGLFDRWNFTVTESTPYDIEVAVDPEMLGKVFEELVTGRHESGSYYTPKPIVSFMCHEALKGYLETAAGAESTTAIQRLVDDQDASSLHNPEAILDALRKVKVCDPACGSGAYLLGMLHELLELRACLFAVRQIDHDAIYERKLEIIQNNIYGVDKDPFAIGIAQLRLWLSLIVDYEGATPPALPNLDFKIEVGDSLTGPNPSDAALNTDIGFRQQQLRELQRLKSEYLVAHGAPKAQLRSEIQTLKNEIALLTYGGKPTGGFDWAVEFSEVFIGGGFDIAVANPPYVRMELFKDIKPILRKNFPNVHSDRADLYCYFYGRTIELLRQGGFLAFISSNKWLRANYGARLRGYLSNKSSIRIIVDFGELPIFQSAATFPMIFVGRKGGETLDGPMFVQVTSLRAPYPDIKSLLEQNGYALPLESVEGDRWTLSDLDSAHIMLIMDRTSLPLGQYISRDICWGIKTGLNEAFIINGHRRQILVSRCPASDNVIVPLAVGDNVRRWHVTSEDKWLIYTYHGIDMAGQEAIIEHLLPYRPRLESRATKQEWYELQQPQMNYRKFLETDKILFPDIAKESRFTIDREYLYVLNTTYFIPCDDCFLLAVFNSTSLWNYAKERLSVLGDASKGGRLRFFRGRSEIIERWHRAGVVKVRA